MLDVIIYIAIVAALFFASRWIVGLLIQAFISLLHVVVELLGIIVLLTLLAWIIAPLLR
jgi:hypothetical protein